MKACIATRTTWSFQLLETSLYISKSLCNPISQKTLLCSGLSNAYAFTMDSEALLRETQATPNDANTAASNGAPDTATWPLQLKIEKIKPTIWSAYAHANCCALFRWLVNLLVLGATAMTVANGSIPKIMPFAIYSVACVSR